MVAIEIEGDHLIVSKVALGRDDYSQGLAEIFGEWTLPEDEEAWRDI